MKCLSMIITVSFFCFIANMVDAFDLYGASVNDQDAPSSYMKYGIHGYRPTISNVTVDSPANRAGFSQGDIAFSINGKNVKKASDLGSFTTDILKVLVFSGNERKILSINRLAIVTEMKNKIACQSALKIDPPSASKIDPPQVVVFSY